MISKSIPETLSEDFPEYSIIEERCWLGPNVVLTNARYPNHPRTKKELKGVFIKKNAKIGAGSVVTKHVHENKTIEVIFKNLEKLI